MSIFVLAFAGCSGGSSAQPAPSPTPPTVRVIPVVEGTIHPALTIPGAIAPYQTVALSNAISEPASDVYVQEGDRVRAGQALAQLDVSDLEASLRSALQTARSDHARTAQSEYTAQLTFAQAPTQVQQARASLLQARETLDEARLNLERDRRLVRQGYLPQQNFDEQRVVVGNDEQALSAAGAAVTSAIANQRINGNASSGLQAADVAASQSAEAAQYATAEQLERQIGRARITSPIDGFVINRNLNPGEYPSGRQIFTLEASATVYAILTASAVQAYQVHDGDGVWVVRSGMPRGRFRGRVTAILDAATPGSTNFTIKVMIPNRDGELRAGTPVQATVDLQSVRGAAVPISAFINETRSRVVTVSGGRAHIVDVTEIATDGATSIVDGIRAGTRVVRDGTANVLSGQSVAVAK